MTNFASPLLTMPVRLKVSTYTTISLRSSSSPGHAPSNAITYKLAIITFLEILKIIGYTPQMSIYVSMGHSKRAGYSVAPQANIRHLIKRPWQPGLFILSCMAESPHQREDFQKNDCVLLLRRYNSLEFEAH